MVDVDLLCAILHVKICVLACLVWLLLLLWLSSVARAKCERRSGDVQSASCVQQQLQEELRIDQSMGKCHQMTTQ
jgi:hypothetical protein